MDGVVLVFGAAVDRRRSEGVLKYTCVTSLVMLLRKNFNFLLAPF
jgi:hypothetical protein